MVKTNRVILILLIFCTHFSCFNSQKDNNKFYQKTGDIYNVFLNDSIRLYSTSDYYWFFKPLYGEIGLRNELEVDKLSFSEDYMVIYSGLTSVDYEMSEAWFVFDLNNKKQILFKNEENFKDYTLTTFNKEIDLLNVNDVVKKAKAGNIIF